ncbi:MAG: citryl-CoA lyase [Acidobacteria bacterium]|nr:citryl-CoA lyase [Acidobacteriota bacterium]
MSNDLKWNSKITKVEPNNVIVHGYPIQDLMGKIRYSDGLYMILKGELPDEKQSKMLEAILVSSIDHGCSPPSTLAARTVASTGAPINAAIAAGILSINKFHGGAIENAMLTFQEIKATAEKENIDLSTAAKDYVTKTRNQKKTIFGFGHRMHTDDPRQKKLYDMAKELGFDGPYIEISLAVKDSIKEVIGKDLPINVDGAIAALLCEMDFAPILANAFFIIARLPGLLAHIYEEQTDNKPMRKIHPTDYEYIGTDKRSLK